MRKLLVLGLSALLVLAVLPTIAAAADPTPVPATDYKTWENKEQGLSFEYPAQWKVAPGEPRGLLPNEMFNIRTSADPQTAFQVVVYKLDVPATDDNIDDVLEKLDHTIEAWVAKLPKGNLIDNSDITVDDADGKEYVYEYEANGQLIHADMVIIPNGDKAYEITQWAKDAEYDDRAEAFDDIFSSLHLPWTPPA